MINVENKKVESSIVTDYRYRYSDSGISDLITIKVRNTFLQKNTFGIGRRICFDEEVTGRAFTGTYYSENDASANDKWVFIFPEWGEAYHNQSCTYIKGSSKLEYLSREIMRDYEPCKLCNASSAQIGSPVFCFTRYGEVYHIPECSVVDRYYIEVRCSEAESKGYRPCSKCGG